MGATPKNFKTTGKDEGPPPLRVSLETKPLEEKTLGHLHGKAKNGLTG
jgi:hypothetical protein